MWIIVKNVNQYLTKYNAQKKNMDRAIQHTVLRLIYL